MAAINSKKTNGVHGNVGKAGIKKRRAPNPEALLEEQKRISIVKKMIAMRMHKHEIKDTLKQLHNVQWRHAETIIARAHKELALEAGKTQDEHRVDSYAFYVSALRDPQLPMQIKLMVQERIDKLFALEKHTIIHQGAKDSPILIQNQVIDPISLIDRARALAKEAEEARGGRTRLITVDATVRSEGGQGATGTQEAEEGNQEGASSRSEEDGARSGQGHEGSLPQES
jgi:hypothetical protein